MCWTLHLNMCVEKSNLVIKTSNYYYLNFNISFYIFYYFLLYIRVHTIIANALKLTNLPIPEPLSALNLFTLKATW